MVGGLVVLGFHARPPTATKHATTRQARPQDPAGNPLDVVELLRLTPERGQWRLAPSPGAAEQTAEVYLAPEIQLRDAYKAEWLAYRRDQAFTPDAAKLGGLQFATGVADSRSPANEIHITVG